jgi:hypothetical protein
MIIIYFFGDCDYYKGNEPVKFLGLLISFLDEFYNIKITLDDISHTINKSKLGSNKSYLILFQLDI